jgi:hypothetical protein
MTNKHLTQSPSGVLKARLEVLLEDTNNLYRSGQHVLEEDLVSTYNKALDTFLFSIHDSILGQASKIKKGMPADPFYYNSFTTAIGQDLDVLFGETLALNNMIVSGFNSIISEQEEIKQTSKRISNKIGDYLLFADPSLGAGFFFGDSFNSAERIELKSSLIEGEECYLGKEEGAVFLPLDGEPDRPKVKNIIVNSISNGTPGNSFQIDAVNKTEIEAITDNEPNTWFEYEKVTAYESAIPLVLDLTLVLQDVSVINHIHINPINFGTPSPITIVSLETSLNGKEYRSVLDDIPTKEYIKEDREEAFSLSPATSKFAGQGFYSFLPRKAQYVHVTFAQRDPSSIQTVNGERLRYAIGLRDINILGRKFKKEGSIVSTPFSSKLDLRKVSIWTAELPVSTSGADQANTLTSIKYALSENDGAVWREIQPTSKDNLNVAEVINYNNISTGSIDTEEPVLSLRHKISMKRNKEAFQGEVVVKREKLSYSEVLSLPAGNPELILSNKPISESVRILLPFFGSYSCPLPRTGFKNLSAPMDLDFLEFKVDVSPVDSLRFDLPALDIENIKEHIRILVNGELWEYCEKEDVDTGKDTSYESGHVGIDDESKIYFLNKNGRELQFGYNIEEENDEDWVKVRKGALPPGGARVQICLDGDNPRLELTDKGYILNLSSYSDGFKENCSLVSVNALSKGESIYKSFACSQGQDRFVLPVADVGSRVSTETQEDVLLSALDSREVVQFKGDKNGLTLPVIDPDMDSWSIDETINTDVTHWDVKSFKYKVPFENGKTEFERDIPITPEVPDYINNPVEKNKRYTLDPSTGVLYLAQKIPEYHSVTFKYKVLDHTVIPESGWSFYRTEVTNRIDTKKIILDPQYVKTIKRKLEVDVSDSRIKNIDLIGDITDNNEDLQPKTHGWKKQRLVKGTIVLSDKLFESGVKITEVPFENGLNELYDVVTVEDETVQAVEVGSGLWSFTLNQISNNNKLFSPPRFASVRSLSNPITASSQFKLQALSFDTIGLKPEGNEEPNTVDADYNWAYEIDSTGVCTVKVKIDASDTLGNHEAQYVYTVDDPGVDTSGLYSVDYEHGVVHFANDIVNNGIVEYEVSTYSAFYNIASLIKDSDVVEVNEETKEIIVTDSLAMKFLKQSSVLKARPSYLRVIYDYYRNITESLADLEPYYSPVCKDIAIRGVTADLLEEL